MGVLSSTASFFCCSSPKWIFNLLRRYFWYCHLCVIIKLRFFCIFFLDYLGEAQGPKFDLRLSPFTLVLNKNTGMLMGEALQLSVISFWDSLLL